MRIFAGVIFIVPFAAVFTFAYFGASEPEAWSEVFTTYIAFAVITSVLLGIEVFLARALLRRQANYNRKENGKDVTVRMVWNAMAISLLPALLISMASSMVIGRWIQPPSNVGNTRELIDDMNRAQRLRLRMLASETIVFSPDDNGDFVVKSIRAGADCVWVLDMNGKIEKGGSIEPSESNFAFRPDMFTTGMAEGTFVQSLSDGLELWKVNDRICLAVRRPIWELGTRLGDFVVGQYTATDFAERYAWLETQTNVGKKQRFLASPLRDHAGATLLLAAFLFWTLTFLVLCIQTLMSGHERNT